MTRPTEKNIENVYRTPRRQKRTTFYTAIEKAFRRFWGRTSNFDYTTAAVFFEAGVRWAERRKGK